jgi:hypothetical protein
MIEQLRLKAVELQDIDKNKYELISDILSDDNCFDNMDMETTYSILNDLGIENINEVYIELMKRK